MAKDSVVDPSARDKYLLQVTAGPTYDPTTHQEIPVNGPDSTCIESPFVTSWLKVRIKDYHGLPHNSPASSPYFQHPLHTSDRYSIAFSFVPKQNLSGKDVVIGFDYDHSIRHQLPPGFKYAMKIATSMLDPGLYSDAYCDEPYLYGPALSGLFTLNVGEKTDVESAASQLAALDTATGGVVEEGGTGSGASVRDTANIPSRWKKRRKHFLNAQNLESFVFEKGRMYHADFFNPHLDFANFSLRLPGFSISVARYIDEKTHHLRYVLKNRSTGEVLFVVFFKLLFGEELERTLEERGGQKGDAESQVRREGDVAAENEGVRPPRGDLESVGDSKNSSTEQPPAQASSSAAQEGEEEDESGYSATSAVTSLSNSIYSAFIAMGLWDEESSSSDSEVPASPKPADKALDPEVDKMDDATVEKFLQSRHSNV